MRNKIVEKCLLLIILSLSIHSNKLNAQQNTNSLEIEPYLRWDNYPSFTNNINSISNFTIDINGESWGVNSSYIKSLQNNYSIKLGVGYFRYSFNEIKSFNSSFGTGNARRIDYPTTLGLNIRTDRYAYNTVSASFGVSKRFALSKNLQLRIDGDIINYFTFSQYYHLPYDNSFIPQPELQIKNNYKTFKQRYFGLGADLNVGILKRVGKINIGPNLIIPVYDNWRQDDIFPTENNSDSRSKWFSGVGVGIICNYPISKLKDRKDLDILLI